MPTLLNPFIQPNAAKYANVTRDVVGSGGACTGTRFISNMSEAVAHAAAHGIVSGISYTLMNGIASLKVMYDNPFHYGYRGEGPYGWNDRAQEFGSEEQSLIWFNSHKSGYEGTVSGTYISEDAATVYYDNGQLGQPMFKSLQFGILSTQSDSYNDYYGSPTPRSFSFKPPSDGHNLIVSAMTPLTTPAAA